MSRRTAACLLFRLANRGASIFADLIPAIAVIHSANLQAQSTTESTTNDPCRGLGSLRDQCREHRTHHEGAMLHLEMTLS